MRRQTKPLHHSDAGLLVTPEGEIALAQGVQQGQTTLVDKGVIYAAGGFTKAGDAAREGLAAFDTEGNLLAK